MYFEDYEIGTQYQVPTVQLTEQEIIDFAGKFDPRPIHLDQAEAAKSRFGGIIASGFHTISACWGEWVKMKIDAEHLVAGMSIDSAEWLRPVYPLDRLDGIVTILNKKVLSENRYGAITFYLEVKNQNDDIALKFTATAMFKCRP
ncbi:MAG: MaoC/PaaZ C-terminal domain-containing protein [Saccharofermentanales bacterium]|jgi:acyl dehydratase